MDADRSRLINLMPTEKVNKVFQQAPSQFTHHKKTESYHYNGQPELDLSYL